MVKPPVVVVGLAPQGLFVLRELARAGHAVHVVDFHLSAGFHSRYGVKHQVADRAELAATLRRLAENLGPGTRCHITSGFMLDVIREHIPEVWEWFEVFPRPLAAVEQLGNKCTTYALARELGIPVLETFGAADEASACAVLADDGQLIAKWNREAGGEAPRAFKTRLLTSPDQWPGLLAQVPDDDRDNLLLQRYVASDQDRNVAYLGYYVEGRCVAGYLAQQLRQYPQGITSFVREYQGPGAQQLVDQSRALFAAVGYTGFGEAEYKFDQDFATAYLLEVNPRTCGWSSALRARYADLTPLFRDPAPDRELAADAQGTTWCNLLRDAMAIMQQARTRRSPGPLWRGFGSHWRVRAHDVFDRRDPKPFVMQLTKRRSG